ncbi:hypothetical protein HanXRQr2_Chr09g0406601 [Helianthus annuus]|uniref:Uncharacterized protein n=1 Tax=Helianthus annuus TaxID=4232 RepID=A0A251TZL8_HELAN|nr:hypothetical protein HanXRQr2_Chr09g0406601 [Helianthus annuus]
MEVLWQIEGGEALRQIQGCPPGVCEDFILEGRGKNAAKTDVSLFTHVLCRDKP